MQAPPKDNSFEQLFRHCCLKYDHLQMFVAWVGDPANNIPYSYLNDLDSVTATVGISFYQSHPRGIEYLMKLDKNIRIMNEQPLFHPKVYIFSKGKQKAMLIGSSNFTYHGFCENVESNLLLEGPQYQKLIAEKEAELIQWRSPEYSFKPTKTWLVEYREKYKKRQDKLRKVNVKDEAAEEIASVKSDWLENLSWKEYLQEINDGIDRQGYNEAANDVIGRHLSFLDIYKKEIPLPWKVSYFDEKKKRKMMWGDKPYWWLGRVGASGKNKGIIKQATTKQKQLIVEVVNSIGAMSDSIDYVFLERQLNKLTAMGPTIKFWARFLAITRPDLYCTMASNSLRKNIAERLGTTQSHLCTVKGYVQFIRFVHTCEWYKSSKPARGLESRIWENRVAFIDEVFH